ncbi:MAG: class I SAM-dependent methyltransferase [Planctomycetia bacterium]|nr:class I SAM-dependent methyltransferase [Planctomycetia bacterium]
MPLEHEIAEGRRFDGFAGDYDCRTSDCPVRTTVRNRLVEIVRTLRPRIVVDLGCGTGAALIALAPSIELGIGLDVSHEMLKVAVRNAAVAGAANLKFAFGSFHDLNSKHQFWPVGTLPDVIMQNYALHHLPRDEKRTVIDSMVRALSPAAGFAVLGDLMFFDDPVELEAEYAAAGYDPQNDHPETATALAKMLEDLGCVVQTYPVHPLAGIIVGQRRQSNAGSSGRATNVRTNLKHPTHHEEI